MATGLPATDCVATQPSQHSTPESQTSLSDNKISAYLTTDVQLFESVGALEFSGMLDLRIWWLHNIDPVELCA